jgi:outer membrane cobalamin receptor
MRPIWTTVLFLVRQNATGVAPDAQARPTAKGVQRTALIVLFLLTGLVNQSFAAPQEDQGSGEHLKQLSLAELGNVEVTTTSKEPEKIWKTSAAIYVLTQDDIRRSGATSIPEVLRLVPGVEVARINSNSWSVGIRGFGSAFRGHLLIAHHRIRGGERGDDVGIAPIQVQKIMQIPVRQYDEAAILGAGVFAGLFLPNEWSLVLRLSLEDN